MITIMRRIFEDGPVTLTELRSRIREDASANHKSYTAYQDAAARHLESHGLLDPAGRRVRFAHPLVYIDLGGIAKGFAVDRCIAIIEAAGISAAAVAAGGDSRIIGDRRGEPWTVGVQDPRNDESMAVLLPLVDTAVSTSGDYERFFVEDGVRYHHILDPRTGDSARAVTVIGTGAPPWSMTTAPPPV